MKNGFIRSEFQTEEPVQEQKLISNPRAFTKERGQTAKTV